MQICNLRRLHHRGRRSRRSADQAQP